MSQALRLFDPAAEQPDTLYFERRATPRRSIGGSVSAIVREPGHNDESEGAGRMCALKLRDISDGGIGAVAQESIAVGSRITVFFPPHGAEPGFDRVGSVVRCRSIDNRHDIGVSLESTAKRAG
ncbi:MAG: PilZ domain-containing protein [Planctomycetota bacterium]